MSSRTETVKARIDSNLKKSVEDKLKNLGLKPSEAIRLFYVQVDINNGLPFEIKIPNETTIRTFEKTDRGEELNRVNSISDLKRELDI